MTENRITHGSREQPLPQTRASYAERPSSRNMPTMDVLQDRLTDASMLVDDIVLKKYLYRLKDFEIVPLDPKLKQIRDIRLFKITEMVYQKDEYSTYKFASVFSAMQNLNCGVFILQSRSGSSSPQ